MRLPKLCVAAMAVLGAWAGPASAHPHAWITVATTIIVNDQGEATAMREHWLFDKMYSAYAVQDFNPHGNDTFDAADLVKLADENVANLKDFDYFTRVEGPDGKPVALGTAKDVTGAFENAPEGSKDEADRVTTLAKDIRSRTRDYPAAAKGEIDKYVDALSNRRQIAMDFTVPFKAPVSLGGKAVVYRIYDPTYYTDMTHRKGNSVAFVREKSGTKIPECKAKVEIPKVDPVLAFSAAAIDKNGTAPRDLGYFFSEKVTLSCSPTS